MPNYNIIQKNPDNVYVEDGKLTITAWNEAYDKNQYTSTRLVTRGEKRFLIWKNRSES